MSGILDRFEVLVREVRHLEGADGYEVVLEIRRKPVADEEKPMKSNKMERTDSAAHGRRE